MYYPQPNSDSHAEMRYRKQTGVIITGCNEIIGVVMINIRSIQTYDLLCFQPPLRHQYWILTSFITLWNLHGIAGFLIYDIAAVAVFVPPLVLSRLRKLDLDMVDTSVFAERCVRSRWR
ncbi:hypothetical protein BC938DRAFT_480418, partial [Jimgerdemannia flammicorona]